MCYVIPDRIMELVLKKNKTKAEQKECSMLCRAASASFKNNNDNGLFGFWAGFFTGRLI